MQLLKNIARSESVNPAKPAYVMDSYALLAYLNGEAGQTRVQEILTVALSDEAEVFLGMINLGEILYIVERRRGLTQAQRTLTLIESLPLTICDTTRALVLDAAHIKAGHSISYADAFVAALAQSENAIVVTGDPEFQFVTELVRIEWLQ
jgi:predicted nucleic acid-binding protein